MNALERVTRTAAFVREFFQGLDQGSRTSVFATEPGNLPVWMKHAARFYEFALGNAEVTLIVPSADLGFDQATNLYRVFERMGSGPALLLADHLPAKSRGVLVRMGIPHVVTDNVIFAPHLGVSYGKLQSVVAPKEVREELPPLGLKIATLFLLKPAKFEQPLTLLGLQQIIAKELSEGEFALSQSTLSRTCRQLKELGILKGADVSWRPISFEDPQSVWARLVKLEVKTVAKKITAPSMPDKSKYRWVYSGDSALAKMSDLSEPQRTTIAMSVAGFNQWQEQKYEGKPIGYPEDPGLEVEVWRGDPTVPLYHENGVNCLNPIELALSMRRNTDPRIRIALNEALQHHGLDANLFGELP